MNDEYRIAFSLWRTMLQLLLFYLSCQERGTKKKVWVLLQTFGALPKSHRDSKLSSATIRFKCDTRLAYHITFVISPINSFYNSFYLSTRNLFIGINLIMAKLTNKFLLVVRRNSPNQVHVWHAPSKLHVTSRENKNPSRVTLPLLSVAVSLFPGKLRKTSYDHAYHWFHF